jgi:hypothetical protein
MANDTTNVNPLVLDTTNATYTLPATITVHTALYVNGTTAGHNATIAQDSHTLFDVAISAANQTVVVNFPRGLTITNNRPVAFTIDSGQLLLYHG